VDSRIPDAQQMRQVTARGKISRNDKMVSRVTFTGAAFHTVEVYVPFRDERARRLVMCAAAVIDRLIGKPRK